jgi:hypothetical protein
MRGKEVDVVAEAEGKPLLVVLVNGSNRPAARLTRSLMNYAEMAGEEELSAAVVWLDDDPTAAQQYLQRAISWWGIGPPVGISIAGAEGPGSYGLNRNVNVTVLVAHQNRVTANFAIVQPSETDAPRILKEVVQLIGGEIPSIPEAVFLSVPTRKPDNAKWHAAPQDVDFRRLVCNLLAARDETSATAAAQAIEKFVHNDPEREAQLQHIADMLSKGRTRVERIPAAKTLRRWRAKKPASSVRLTESARDESAGGMECYRVDTTTATYFLDKVGAGLSSMIDRDGNDWIGFHPRKGSGAGGEYRGFPNAVFRAAGSYFHPQNAATDPCKTKIEESTAHRIVISAVSDNGLWAGRYTFTAASCTFTMTKKPANHNYWVLYEGTPGGQYDDSDWWMTSASPTRRPLTVKHDGDIADSEWIAFGDPKLNRMLVLSHAEDDQHPDRFYQMQKKMTVFGFGRAGMKKSLDSVPQSFSVGFVESTKHEHASQFAATHASVDESK